MKKNLKLTQERVKELFYYNPKTGTFTRRIYCCSNAKVGDVAGSRSPLGYILINVDYKLYGASRLAFLYMEGYFPEHQVDHINRIRDDNRWENLRHVTSQCNIRNSSVRGDNTSGVTGVCWHKGNKKWASYIMVNEKRKSLGYFKILKEAVQARWEAEVKYDFPNCNTTSSAYLYLQESDLAT